MEYKDLERINKEIDFIDIKGKKYADVANRVKAFRKLHPDGSIQTRMISNENGICIMEAECHDAAGKLLSTGHAYEKEDSSFINKTSYIENCETSAVGRALGFIGIGVDNDIASAQEIMNAEQQQADEKPITKVMATALEKKCEEEGVPMKLILDLGKVTQLKDMKCKVYSNLINHWDKVLEKRDKNDS